MSELPPDSGEPTPEARKAAEKYAGQPLAIAEVERQKLLEELEKEQRLFQQQKQAAEIRDEQKAAKRNREEGEALKEVIRRRNA